MASEREEAKGSIVQQESEDPELADTLGAAHAYQIAITKEANRHAEAMRKHDLGFFGRAFGGENSAPTYIAAIAAFFGVIGVAFTVYSASGGEGSEFWSKQTERLLAFTLACLTFIFGRGNK